MSNIKKFRILRGLKQRELAEMVGVSRLSIARYESGSRVPDLKIFSRIADALGCTLDELVGREEKTN